MPGAVTRKSRLLALPELRGTAGRDRGPAERDFSGPQGYRANQVA
jgi:hypothetical protein